MKNIIKSKKLDITFKSLLVALGIAVTAHSCSVMVNPEPQEDITIENENPDLQEDITIENENPNLQEDTTIENENSKENNDLTDEESKNPIDNDQNNELSSETENKEPTSSKEKEEVKKPSDSKEKEETKNNNSNNNKEENSNNNQEDNSNDNEEEKHRHTFKNWRYYDDEKEIGFCIDCDEEDYRKHKIESQSQYRFNSKNNGTHTIIETKQCEGCEHEFITENVVDCNLGSWSYNQTTGKDEKTCNDCGYNLTKEHEHNFIVDPNLVTSNSTIGLHNVTEKCNGCGTTKDVQVSCTSDGTKHLEPDGSQIKEREYCMVCGDVCIESPHNHIYGNYAPVDDDIHERECACGDKSSEAHSYGDFSISEDGTNTRSCSICGRVQTITCTHDNIQTTETTVGTADVCWEIVEKCNDCGYESIITTSHEFHEDRTDFTVVYTCYKCPYSYSEETFELTTTLNEDITITNEEENHAKQLVLK